MTGTAYSPTHTRPTGWRRLLALRPELVDFERRGFRTAPAATRETLQTAGGAFLTGFNLELAVRPSDAPDLAALPEHLRGFAAEGAAMAAVLLDLLNPAGGHRFAALRAAHEARYVHLLQVGAGWALAKLHRRRLRRLGADLPLLRWLAYDGMGFCQAFFAGPRAMRRWSDHPGRCDAVCEIRYQGLGRSLWFRECADPQALAATVRGLPVRHHSDVWSGIGLAAAYAGGTAPEALARLRRLAGDHQPALAQGVAFAAGAWARCGYAPPHAHLAADTLVGVPLDQAAGWTDTALHRLDTPAAGPAEYRTWRMRIQQAAASVA